MMRELRRSLDRELLPLPPAITYEAGSRNPAAMRRRFRHGTSAPTAAGKTGALPVEIRNGLPFKPYIYRGLGYDIYLPEGGDDDGDD